MFIHNFSSRETLLELIVVEFAIGNNFCFQVKKCSEMPQEASLQDLENTKSTSDGILLIPAVASN